jgi:hypothetical protein
MYIPRRLLVIGDWCNNIIAILDVVCMILCRGALSTGLFLAGQCLENLNVPRSTIGFGIWLMMLLDEFALAMVTAFCILGFFNTGARIPELEGGGGRLARHARNWLP